MEIFEGLCLRVFIEELKKKINFEKYLTLSVENLSSSKRAFGGCLGTKRRRRTWYAAKSGGEARTAIDPSMSEWGNPPQ